MISKKLIAFLSALLLLTLALGPCAVAATDTYYVYTENGKTLNVRSAPVVSDGTLELNGLVRPAGSQNEAYFECQWGLGAAGAYNKEGQRINNWLVAWPGAFRLETLRRINDWDLLRN